MNNIDQTFKTRYEVNIQNEINIFLITVLFLDIYTSKNKSTTTFKW
jgi:hypothetical protein